MIHAEADQPKNLLSISFSGNIDRTEIERSEEKIKSLVAEFRPGFRLLSDLTRLEKMDPQCAPVIERMMDVCDCAGIAQVVRVIPDPQKDIGLNIMSLFHYRRGVRIITCETLAEAQAALNDAA